MILKTDSSLLDNHRKSSFSFRRENVQCRRNQPHLSCSLTLTSQSLSDKMLILGRLLYCWNLIGLRLSQPSTTARWVPFTKTTFSLSCRSSQIYEPACFKISKITTINYSNECNADLEALKSSLLFPKNKSANCPTCLKELNTSPINESSPQADLLLNLYLFQLAMLSTSSLYQTEALSLSIQSLPAAVSTMTQSGSQKPNRKSPSQPMKRQSLLKYPNQSSIPFQNQNHLNEVSSWKTSDD